MEERRIRDTARRQQATLHFPWQRSKRIQRSRQTTNHVAQGVQANSEREGKENLSLSLFLLLFSRLHDFLCAFEIFISRNGMAFDRARARAIQETYPESHFRISVSARSRGLVQPRESCRRLLARNWLLTLIVLSDPFKRAFTKRGNLFDMAGAILEKLNPSRYRVYLQPSSSGRVSSFLTARGFCGYRVFSFFLFFFFFRTNTGI